MRAAVEPILNYIDGELVEPQGGDWLDNVEPATGRVYSRVPASRCTPSTSVLRYR